MKSTWFERGERTNGEKFYTLSSDAPEWLREAVYEAHQGNLPNDWVYEECRAAFEAYLDGDFGCDLDVHEHADSRVDVYTKVLMQWIVDFCLTSLYARAKEAAEGMGTECDMTKHASVVQYCAIASIAQTIAQACQDAEESEES